MSSPLSQTPQSTVVKQEGLKGPKTFLDLFEAYAKSHGECDALAFGGASVSYRELNERAEVLASYLRSSGVKKDVFVAISMNRGFDMITSIFAVMKAGGAFLSIDPNYPLERRKFMLQDVAPRLLLTDSETWAASGIDVPELQPVLLDDEWEDIENSYRSSGPAEAGDNLNRPDQMAYVIYTSGTTGQPKGAMNTHGGC